MARRSPFPRQASAPRDKIICATETVKIADRPGRRRITPIIWRFTGLKPRVGSLQVLAIAPYQGADCKQTPAAFLAAQPVRGASR